MKRYLRFTMLAVFPALALCAISWLDSLLVRRRME
jgi:hypothetical protein